MIRDLRELKPLPESKDSQRRLKIGGRKISNYKQGLVTYLCWKFRCYDLKFQYFLASTKLNVLEAWERVIRESNGLNGLYHARLNIKTYLVKHKKKYLFDINMLKINPSLIKGSKVYYEDM